MTTYREFHARSISDPAGFWGEQAPLIDWHTPFTQVLEYSRPPFAKWFVGGTTNLCRAAGPGEVRAVVRRGQPTAVPVSLTSAPGDPSAFRGPGYAEGHPPLRDEIATPASPGIHALPTDMRILVVSSSGYVEEIRRLLAAFDDVPAVDSFDAYYQTPTRSSRPIAP